MAVHGSICLLVQYKYQISMIVDKHTSWPVNYNKLILLNTDLDTILLLCILHIILFYYAASGQGIVNSAQTKVWVDVDISMYRGSMFNFLLPKLRRDFTMDNMTLIIDFMI